MSKEWPSKFKLDVVISQLPPFRCIWSTSCQLTLVKYPYVKMWFGK